MTLTQVPSLSLLMLNLESWNIRGLNTPIKQLEVKKLADNNLSLLVLNETRVKKLNHAKVLSSITR